MNTFSIVTFGAEAFSVDAIQRIIFFAVKYIKLKIQVLSTYISIIYDLKFEENGPVIRKYRSNLLLSKKQDEPKVQKIKNSNVCFKLLKIDKVFRYSSINDKIQTKRKKRKTTNFNLTQISLM